MTRDHRDRFGACRALQEDSGGFGLWQEGADVPRGLRRFTAVFERDGMRPEDAERVAVISLNYCFHFGGCHGNFDYMARSELHLHLEGTVDRETLLLLDPTLTREVVDQVWSYTDFAGFLSCFKFIAGRLRGPDDYALITRRMIAALARQGISYAEVTLGAGVVLWRELEFNAVWRAIREAQAGAQASARVEVWWNLDAIRQFGPDHVMEIARLASRYVGDGAISFGIGGDEVRGEAGQFRDAYRYAKDAGLHLTAHAGETDGPASIRAALEIGAERIGHGIRGAEDADLMRRLRDENIPLEVCITSNVRTGAVKSLRDHPVRKLFDAGVPITLNTDDPGVFETDLAHEFSIAREVFGFSPAELARVEAAAEKFRFA
jgi:adenosine deaminase/aminodeoxyfutalosine deaminase